MQLNISNQDFLAACTEGQIATIYHTIKIHNGMWYKRVIRPGGQAITMMTIAASSPGQK